MAENFGRKEGGRENSNTLHTRIRGYTTMKQSMVGKNEDEEDRRWYRKISEDSDNGKGYRR